MGLNFYFGGKPQKGNKSKIDFGYEKAEIKQEDNRDTYD